MYKKRETGSEVRLVEDWMLGDYIGINPMAILNGGSFEQSQVRFNVAEDGVRIESDFENDGKPNPFIIHFSLKWLFRYIDQSLAISEVPRIEAIRLDIDFAPDPMEFTNADALLMARGSLLVGVMFRKDRHEDAELILRSYYDYYLAMAVEDKRVLCQLDSILIEDQSSLIHTMYNGTIGHQLEIVKEVGNCFLDNIDVDRAIELARIGLLPQSHDEVKLQVLRECEKFGRTVKIVPMLVDFLTRDIRLMRFDILSYAIEAVAYLLFEIRKVLRYREAIQQEFGSADLSVIHDSCGGQVTPEQFDLIDKLASLPPDRRFTSESRLILLRTIENVISKLAVDRTYYDHVITRCKGLLIKY